MLHELATDAAKYGSLSNFAGTVHIEWEVLDGHPGLVRLLWQEHCDPVVEKPERKGFGSRLIERGLASEFHEIVLEFQREGVTCAMEFSRTFANSAHAE